MNFRFESMLRLNKNKENLLLKDMGKINTLYQRQNDRKQLMLDATERTKEELNQKKRSEVSVETMILYDNFSQGIRTQGTKQDKIMEEINSKLEAKRKEVIEAVRKRRTLEILKERDLLKERKIREKKETVILDEVGSNLWMRQH